MGRGKTENTHPLYTARQRHATRKVDRVQSGDAFFFNAALFHRCKLVQNARARTIVYTKWEVKCIAFGNALHRVRACKRLEECKCARARV